MEVKPTFCELLKRSKYPFPHTHSIRSLEVKPQILILPSHHFYIAMKDDHYSFTFKDLS